MAKRIDSGLINMANAHLLNLGDTIVVHVEHNDITEVRENPVYIRFVEVLGRYSQSFKKTGRSGLNAAAIRKADKRRTDYYYALKHGLEALVLCGQEKAKSAKDLLVAMLRIKGIPRMAYGAKTVAIETLEKRLLLEPYASKLDEVGLRYVLDALAGANKEFRKLRMEKSSARADREEIGTSTSIKPEFIAALRDLVNVAHAMRDVPIWKDFNSNLIQRIHSAKISAKGRVRAKKSETEADDGGGGDAKPTSGVESNSETNTNTSAD